MRWTIDLTVVNPFRALVGKSEGDEVVVKAPGGDVEYEIGEVKYI